jgi:hypothetical protein
MDEAAIQKATAVKARYEARLMQKANVIGVGVGFRERGGRLTDEIVLVVNVTRKLPRHQLAPQDWIPNEIEGVPVDVREIGQMRALGA